jgi:hypothetical protein
MFLMCCLLNQKWYLPFWLVVVYGLARVDSGWAVARSVHCEISGLKLLRLLEILRIEMT